MRLEALHGRAEAPHSGKHNRLGAAGLSRAGGHPNAGTEALQRLSGAAQIAHLIIEEDHIGPRRNLRHRLPLLDGTPLTRGFSATAARSARATPLKHPSMTWCGPPPDRTSTCRVIRDAFDIPRRNS